MVFDLTSLLERHYTTSESEMVPLLDVMNHVRGELSEMEQPLWSKARLATELRMRGVTVARAVDRLCVPLERRQTADASVQGSQGSQDASVRGSQDEMAGRAG